MKFLIVILIGLSMYFNSQDENPVYKIPSVSRNIVFKDTLKLDSATGLVIDENLYMVKAQCTSCHSSKLIIANHFTREGWKQKIRWMQENHNLWQLGDTEKQVLDSLEKNYAPTQMNARRAPLKDIKGYKLEK